MHCAGEGSMHGFREVCRRARVPEHFTRKMFQKLTQHGMLQSIPGPNGGFRLTRSPTQINLREVIEAIDGHGAFDACVLGLAACKPTRPCALHDTWAAAKKRLIPQLERTTLSMLMRMGPKDRLLRRRKGVR
jgi:Rrf2 family transcriptional regulator, iron-sulfur cluster assembly transcription factor